MDRNVGVNHLADERLAETVENAMLHFAGQRYAIWSWVVMSNHIHWIFEPDHDWAAGLGASADARTPRERIMQSFKRFSARQCNSILGKTGRFWQEESYDHCITKLDEPHRVIEYIEMNPVKAGLCTRPEQFRFSSAWYRLRNNLPPGRPLIGATNLTAFD
jgi:putative DNA methylase